MSVDPEAILEFWFQDCERSREALARRVHCWFSPNPALDRGIRERFGDLPDRAMAGELDAWQETARSALARVLVLDQFPRNLHRDSGRAFACDAQALAAAENAIAQGFDAQLSPALATFLYLPFEHAEDLACQTRCVALLEALASRARVDQASTFIDFVGYANRHREVIARFGRFPHRNQLLGRPSTPEEAAYLRDGGEDFSGSQLEPDES